MSQTTGRSKQKKAKIDHNLVKAIGKEIIKSLAPNFKRIDERFEGVDQRFEGIDQRLDKMDGRLDKMERNTEAEFKEIKAQLADHHADIVDHETRIQATVDGIALALNCKEKIDEHAGRIENLEQEMTAVKTTLKQSLL